MEDKNDLLNNRDFLLKTKKRKYYHFFLREVNFFLQILKNKSRRKFTPLSVFFNLTDKCNLRCKYCYLSFDERNCKELDLLQVKSVIDKLVKAGTRRISFTGGEPLLRDDIGEIIKYASDRNLILSLTTNGILLEKKIRDLLLLDNISISFDGFDPESADPRGIDPQRVSRIIEIACQYFPSVQISATMHKNNLHEIDQLISFSERVGCKINFTPLMKKHYGNVKLPIENLLPDNDDCRYLFRKVAELKKKGKPVLLAYETYKYASEWPDFSKEFFTEGEEIPYKQIIKCSAGRKMFIIDTTGFAYPCFPLIGEMEGINILNNDIATVMKHLSSHKCMTCPYPTHNEMNLIYSFHLKTMMSYFMSSIKRL